MNNILQDIKWFMVMAKVKESLLPSWIRWIKQVGTNGGWEFKRLGVDSGDWDNLIKVSALEQWLTKKEKE